MLAGGEGDSVKVFTQAPRGSGSMDRKLSASSVPVAFLGTSWLSSQAIDLFGFAFARFEIRRVNRRPPCPSWTQ